MSATPDLTETQLRRLNIGRRYWPAELRQIPESASYRAVVHRYALRIREMRARGWGLMLWGPNSRGKTFSASALLKHAVRAGYTGYCITAPALKTCFIEKPWFDEDQTVPQRIETVDFLVIEDIGKEFRGQSGWAELQFESLLRTRTRELLPTIVTTNFAPSEMLEVYNRSALELAFEMMHAVECTGANYRKRQARKMGQVLAGKE